MAQRQSVKTAWIAAGGAVVVAIIGAIATYATLDGTSNEKESRQAPAPISQNVSGNNNAVVGTMGTGNSSLQNLGNINVTGEGATFVVGSALTAAEMAPRIANADAARDQRDKFVTLFLDLRDAMRDCHKSYVAYKTKEGKDGADEKKFQWKSNLQKLILAIRELDEVFSIYSPETKQKLQMYSITETRTFGGRTYLTGPGNDGNVDDALGASFDDALASLDKYIRDEFRPEEIYRARKPSPDQN
jgi:hypothetical protein